MVISAYDREMEMPFELIIPDLKSILGGRMSDMTLCHVQTRSCVPIICSLQSR